MDVHTPHRFAARLLLAIGAVLLPEVAAAQPTYPIEVGDRVRVTYRAPLGQVSGTLMAIEGSDITLERLRGQTFSASLDSVLSVETASERRGHAGTGALIGGLAGAGLGLMAAGAANAIEGGVTGSGSSHLGAVLALTAAGALGGAGIGALIRSDQWEVVRRRFGVLATPARSGGLSLGVRVGSRR